MNTENYEPIIINGEPRKGWPRTLAIICGLVIGASLLCYVVIEEQRTAELSRKPCVVNGYELIGDGKAVTNCGDTINKTTYKVFDKDKQVVK